MDTGRVDRTDFVIETDVPGDPAPFHTAAEYLRTGMGGRIEALGDATATQRSALAATWRGEAGTAFCHRASRLVIASDHVRIDVRVIAAELDTLGDMLRSTQEGLAQLRAEASSMGLRVDGTQVRPGQDFFLDAENFADPGSSPFLDADRKAAAAAWTAAADAAEGYWQQWYDAVNDAGGVSNQRAADIISVLSDLVTVGATHSLRTIASRIMTKQAAWLDEMAETNRTRAGALTDYIARTGDQSARIYHDAVVAEARVADYGADAAREAAKHPHIPREIRGGLGSVSALATGVGIYADVADGESGAQAVVSQGVGLGAGVLGATLSGGIAGSVAPGPGTITGAVVVGGAQLVGGTLAAIGGDQLVDWLWPDGESDQPSTTEQNGGTLLEYAEQVTRPERTE